MYENTDDQTVATAPKRRPGLFGMLRWLVRVLWTGANGVRKFVHMLLMFFILAIAIGSLSDAPQLMPSQSALVIRPEGSIVEQLEGSAYDRAVAELLGESKPQTLLSEVLEAFELAAEDDRIDVVVLDLAAYGGAGMSKLITIGDAIDKFRESGKEVLATADYYSQGSYYLASRADRIFLHHDGFMFLDGFSSYRNYYKTLIDKLRIDWNVFRVGTHKSAVEPFIRDDMSEEDRASRENLLGQLWDLYKSDIRQARDLEDGAIAGLIDEFVARIESTEGSLGNLYVEAGLVDELVTRAGFQEKVLEYTVEDPEREGFFQATGMKAFLSDHRMLNGDTSRDENVAIVVAAGTILNGSQPPGTIGGDSTAALLQRAREDESVKAVVLRVDSPGGSVFASRLIGNEVRALQQAGKPVVASMSSTAASGGYWISMGADRILASPATITGSIGVFGMLPTFERTLDAIGVHTDGTGTTRWAGTLRADRTISDDGKSLVQAVINKDYDDFISQVAELREMDKTEVDRVAQGKVWTGVDAMENGLIDDFGTLDDAIELAAELAEMDDYGTVLVEKELDATEQLVVELLSTASVRELVTRIEARPASPLEQLSEMVERVIEPFALFNDPRGAYSHCFCTME